MKTGWMTVGMLAVAAAILAASPGMRDAAAAVVFLNISQLEMPYELAAATGPVARSHPQDADLWFAYADAVSPRVGQEPLTSTPEVDEAYARAEALDPQSAAVKFRWALSRLAATPTDLTEWPEHADRPLLRHPPRTPEERANLDKARELLLQCEKLDPTNAACDYPLAMVALNEDNDQEAEGYLRAATGKGGFDLYDRETADALAESFRHQASARPLRWLWGHALATLFPDYSRLREMARYLAARAEQERMVGDDARAMFNYEAAVHLGHVMRLQSSGMIGELVGVAVTSIAGGNMLDEAERARLAAVKDVVARIRLQSDLRAAAFAKWATAHGRPDLGEAYSDDTMACESLKQRIRDHSHSQPSQATQFWGDGDLNGVVVASVAAAMGLVGAALGIPLLLTRRRRVGVPPVQVGYGAWLVLLVLALLPVEVAAACVTAGLKHLVYPEGSSMAVPWMPGFAAMSGLGAVLWVARVVVVARRRKARVLPLMVALIGPTVAAVVLVAVIGLVPVERNFKRVDDQYKQMVMVGEMRYWGLDSGEGR